jgi:hypothetical protein
MALRNLGLCNQCRARVPAEFLIRDGEVWIRKDCPNCGPNESRVSTDAAAWQAKRDLWKYVPTEPVACTLHCDRCGVDHKPGMVFLDVTNRCNLNCPICIATIRGMGFDFNPPLEYFEKVFAAIGRMDPKPMVELFGGEPTVRDDLLDIINIGRRHGLKPRVVTNGVRLADEAFCRQLCEAGVRFRFAFDGRSPDIYERLRHNRAAYEKKLRGLENLDRFSRRKHVLIACAAWGINDRYIGDLIQYCHDHRDLISDLGIIPLTENWEKGEFDAAQHTTMEDVEKMIRQAVPGGQVEFVPAGFSYALRRVRAFFRGDTRSETLLLAGVHPNCESMTLLVSDGTTYRSINHYLKKPFTRAAAELADLCKGLEPRLSNLDYHKFFQCQWGRVLIIRALTPFMLGTVNFRRLLGGHPVLGLLRVLAGRVRRRLAARRTPKGRRPRRLIRVAVLPFEEQHSVDAARMEHCKAVFAYEDADDGQVKTIPACLWYPYRNPFLEKLSKKYGVVGRAPPAKAAAPETPAARPS